MISTDSSSNYVRTPRVVQVVHSAKNRVDQKNRKTALRFSKVVHWSTQIYRMAIVEQVRKPESPMTKYSRELNSSGPVDHPLTESSHVLRFEAVHSKKPGVDHLDHLSGEVTQ